MKFYACALVHGHQRHLPPSDKPFEQVPPPQRVRRTFAQQGNEAAAHPVEVGYAAIARYNGLHSGRLG